MLVKLEINNKDRAYDWFLAWLAKQTAAQVQQSRRFALWARSHHLSVETTVEQRKNGSSSALFKLVAGPGTHYVQYRGAWMQVFLLPSPKIPPLNGNQKIKRERETKSMHLVSGTPWETVTLTTLSRDRKLFPELLNDARDLAMHGQEGKLVIHTAWGIEWRPFGQPRQKRPLHSVVLAPGISECIENDLKAFLARRQWYADRGKILGVLFLVSYLFLQGYPTDEAISYTDLLAQGKPPSFRLLRAIYHMIFVS